MLLSRLNLPEFRGSAVGKISERQGCFGGHCLTQERSPLWRRKAPWGAENHLILCIGRVVHYWLDGRTTKVVVAEVGTAMFRQRSYDTLEEALGCTAEHCGIVETRMSLKLIDVGSQPHRRRSWWSKCCGVT